MKDKILTMIEDLDPHASSVIYYALIGMTAGLDTIENMVEALDEQCAESLYFFLSGL